MPSPLQAPAPQSRPEPFPEPAPEPVLSPDRLLRPARSPALSPVLAPALSIAIVGAGPTAVYALDALQRQGLPYRVTLLEAGGQPGQGIPFNAQHNGAHLLANIAGFELPAVGETLNAWAMRQTPQRQAALGLAGMAHDERAFFPRMALGAYYADQLAQAMAPDAGPCIVTLHCHAEVHDIVARPDGVRVLWTQSDAPGAERHAADFDAVIVASGYGKPDVGERLAGATARDSKGRQVAVLGSSLSAIDAAVELAVRHGQFHEAADGTLQYAMERPFSVTFLSRNGLLPEADFWVPEQATPLRHCTPRALASAVRGEEGDLDRAFALFARELAQADPAYAAAMALDTADADSFADRHFARRMAADPFAHARANLAQARASHAQARPSPWRHAILRMHEAFATIVPALAPGDLARFVRGLKRVFVDNYAAVPHLSVERLLALHDAGVLTVQRIASGQSVTRAPDAGGKAGCWAIAGAGSVGHFDDVIDARGQAPLGLEDFPFPTLRLHLCAQALAQDRDWHEGLAPAQGHVLDPEDPALARIHVLSLPFLLHRHPFIQGLTESAAMARACVAALGRRARAASPSSGSAREDIHAALDWLDRTEPIYLGRDVLMVARGERDEQAPPTT
nr:FAD/NAD(P)-binding protein [Novosphingobium sp. SG720]